MVVLSFFVKFIGQHIYVALEVQLVHVEGHEEEAPDEEKYDEYGKNDAYDWVECLVEWSMDVNVFNANQVARWFNNVRLDSDSDR